MAERDLALLARIGATRKLADERRLSDARRRLGEALEQSERADRVLQRRIESLQALDAQCYGQPADPQAWIARERHATLREEAQCRAAGRREDARGFETRRLEAAKAVLRDEVRLSLIDRRRAQERRAADLRSEDATTEDHPMPARRTRA